MSLTESLSARVAHRRDPRQEIFDRAFTAVLAARRRGSILMVKAEADRLWRAQPHCPVPLEDLHDVIALMAMRKGVPLQFG